MPNAFIFIKKYIIFHFYYFNILDITHNAHNVLLLFPDIKGQAYLEVIISLSS